MVHFPGRNSRRRRVLNEEVRSASSVRLACRPTAEGDTVHQAPRYSEAAGVENHPQITDFVPRRYRTIFLLIAIGLATTAMLAGLQNAAALLEPGEALHMGVFDLAAPGSLASWIAAIVMFFGFTLRLLIYSLRRHRIDDYRGRYRIWLAAAAACLLLSSNSVVGLHDSLASALGHVTGWTALRAGAAWWLILGGGPLAWIVLRTLLDVAECRLAASLLVTAVGCYVAAVTTHLGAWSAHIEPLAELTLVGVAALSGHWLMLAAIVSYARYVILDAQGLIPRESEDEVPGVGYQVSENKLSAIGSRRSARSAPAAADSQEPRAESRHAPPVEAWVDGRQPERDRFENKSAEDDSQASTRKLTKADRKRLRKLKAQNRAA